MKEVLQEENKIKRFWIWLWYNDIFRIFFVLIPSYFIILVPFCCYFFGENTSKAILPFVYLFVFAYAMINNDYSNLRRIGMNEYREKIKEE